MISSRFLLPLVIILFGLISIPLFTADAGRAADRDIYGTWDVHDLVDISNETIDVRGDVVVSGELRLRNCTLLVNSSASPCRKLLVYSIGTIFAEDSLIRGSSYGMGMEIRNDSRFEGCTIKGLDHRLSPEGILVRDGDVVFSDCIVEDVWKNALTVCTNLTLVNVTLSGGRETCVFTRAGYYLHDAQGNVTIRLEGCTLNGDLPSATGHPHGIHSDGHYEEDRWVNLYLEDTVIDSFDTGIYFRGRTSDTLSVRDSRILDCNMGISLNQSEGRFELLNTTIARTSRQLSTGLYSVLNHRMDVTIEDCVLSNLRWALYLIMGQGSLDTTVTIEKSRVIDCEYGLYSKGWDGARRLRVDVVECAFSSVRVCFTSGPYGYVMVYDSDHTLGSAYVEYMGWGVQAFVTLNVSSVSWKGDGNIDAGSLVIEDEEGQEMANVDIADPSPATFIGWEAAYGELLIRYDVSLAFYEDGHRFTGEPYEIWNDTSTSIVILDDSRPEAWVLEPRDMEGFAVDRVEVSGQCRDLGSGMNAVEWSVDGAPFRSNLVAQTPGWALELTDLSEGTHNVTIRPIDAAGNKGANSWVRFFIDTIEPPLVLRGPIPDLVNTSEITVEGSTAPDATLLVDGVPFPVGGDGTFSMVLDLEEGSNLFMLSVSDLLGNLNSTSIVVASDRTPPAVTITSPGEGTWFREDSVLLNGTAENGSVLRIMGERVDLMGDRFSSWVPLVEGENRITILATDLAGNQFVDAIVLHGDWTAPVLVIEEPGNDEVHTPDDSIRISGRCIEAHLYELVVNREPVTLLEDVFFSVVPLSVGPNELQVLARDMAGNSEEIDLLVVFDNTPPSYDVNLTPVEGDLKALDSKLYSTASKVRVLVSVDEMAFLELSDGTVLGAAVEHEFDIDLHEGSNNILFSPVDLAGNQGEPYRETLTVDTTPPEIIIDSPRPDIRVEEARVILNGRTEDGARVTLDDEVVPLSPGGGFSHLLTLEVGLNEFKLVAVDVMGNTNSTTVTVERKADQVTDGKASWWPMIIIAVAILVVMVWFLMRIRGRGGPHVNHQP